MRNASPRTAGQNVCYKLDMAIYGGERISGISFFVPAVALLVMGYWTLRVVVWPGALIEAVVVGILAVLVMWRFLRIGIWIDGDTAVIRNAWETFRIPKDEVTIRSGYVDDISEFDRFTGGQANVMRARVGDTLATKEFLRYRAVIDGVEHEIDAFMGLTPRRQRRLGAQLSQYLRVESPADHDPFA